MIKIKVGRTQAELWQHTLINKKNDSQLFFNINALRGRYYIKNVELLQQKLSI